MKKSRAAVAKKKTGGNMNEITIIITPTWLLVAGGWLLLAGVVSLVIAFAVKKFMTYD